jgi:hypothetical protein
LNAWASSTSPDKVKKAWQLISEMGHRYENGDIRCKPNVVAFTFVLKACCFNKNKYTHEDSVRIALLTQEKLFGNTALYGKPDDKFFNRLIQVFGFCIHESRERERFISIAFERCAKEGQVSVTVLESLKKFSPQIYENIGKTLPKEWTRNLLR